MAKNSDPIESDPNEKDLQNSNNSKSEKTSDSNATIVASDTIHTKQKNENGTPKAKELNSSQVKSAWNYLFEFLMLFFAVFCGFMAENWRVQLAENNRQNEFILSIVQDIKSDTLESNLTLKQLNKIRIGIDSVLTLLASPNIMENSNDAYMLWSENLGLEVFVSNDRTIQQLKNSGELRLIRNKTVSDGIMKYDQTLKKYYVQSNLMYSALREVTDYSQLFDFISLQRNPNIPVPLTEQGKESLNQAYANLQLWNKGLIGLISWLEVVNEEGEKLITIIQKEYHLN